MKDLAGSIASVRWQVLAAVAFVICAFLMGGASRGEVASLAVLRPIAILACAVALIGFDSDDFLGNRFLIAMLATMIALAIAHILPLPPAIWRGLPGRSIIADIDAAAGLSGLWRPFTMTPSAGWNALWSLSVPAAILLLAIRAGARADRALLWTLLALASLSALLGVAQTLGGRDGPLYLYRITNYGSAVGLFANRNHQAVFLAATFPMIAAYAALPTNDRSRWAIRQWTARAGYAVLTPLLLITGSRGGLVAMALGLTGALMIARSTGSRRRGSDKILAVLTALTVAGLIGITIIAARAEAFRRLFLPDNVEEVRLPVWRISLELATDYLPFGSGAGSYAEVFQIHEPDGLLIANYANHVHNDWLETAITYGIFGIALLAVGLIAWVRTSWQVWRKPVSESVTLARAGSIIILILGVASIVDYPLRTPSLACLFVIGCIWLQRGCRATDRI